MAYRTGNILFYTKATMEKYKHTLLLETQKSEATAINHWHLIKTPPGAEYIYIYIYIYILQSLKVFS
jgi:hypothetical protein